MRPRHGASIRLLLPLVLMASWPASAETQAAPASARHGSATFHAVLVAKDGSLHRDLRPNAAVALADARAVWVWTDAAAPRRLPAADLATRWATLLRDGVPPGPGTLLVDLPAERTRTSGRVIAAPAAMWGQVPESWLPRFDVPERGPVRVPRDPAVPWRVRYTSPTVGTWWTDVSAGQAEISLHPSAAVDLLTEVEVSDGDTAASATLTVLEDVASKARPEVLAMQQADAGDLLRFPALPPGREATFLVGAPGYPGRPFRGRLGDVPRRVRLSPGVTLRGRFTDADGTPIGGVAVRAGGWLTDDLPVRFERRTRSGEDGTWTLPALSVRPLAITAYRDGFAPFTELREPSRSGTVDLGDQVLEGGEALAVDVADAQGAPVPAAVVSVDHSPTPSVTTGDDGRAFLTGLSASRPLELTVEADGFLPGRLAVEQPWPEEALVALTRAFTVSGRFVDPAGLGVVGGKVRVATGNRFHFEDLAPGGGFELALEPGVPWALELSAPSTRRLSVDVRPGQAGEHRDLGDLAAPPGVTVYGTLVSAVDGTPVAGGRVWMPRSAATGILVSWLYGDVAETTSDELGRFEMAGLAPEPGLLRIDAPGHARKEIEMQPEPEAPDLDLGTVELSGGTTVEIEVTGLEDDVTSPRARLDLRGEWRDLDMLTAPLVDGAAELPNVPAGTSHLSVIAGRDLLCEKDVTVGSDDSRVSVSCDAGRSPVSGHVLVGNHAAGSGLLAWSRTGVAGRNESVIRTRTTPSGLRQQSVAGGGRPEVLVEVDDEGRFRSDRLTAGRWQVTWQPFSGSAAPPRSVDVPQGEVRDLVVRVPGQGLAGVVVDAARQPVAGARVREIGSGAFALADRNGRFDLTGLSAGEVRIQAQAGDRYSDVESLLLEPDRPADPLELVVSTDHEGRIPVQVWDEDGPAAGAFVFVETDLPTGVPGVADLRMASADGRGAIDVEVPAPYPSRVRVAARHEGRWVFGAWTDWKRAGDGIEVAIEPPGQIRVAGEETSGTLSVHTDDGWDVSRLLTRLGAPPHLSPDLPLQLTGLPEGRYLLAFQEPAGHGLPTPAARTVFVTAGHLEDVEIGAEP